MSLIIVVRVGCDLTFECRNPTPALLIIEPHRDSERPIIEEQMELVPDLAAEELKDLYGNLLHRVMFVPGPNRIRYDALVEVPSATDKEQSHGVLLSRSKEVFRAITHKSHSNRAAW
jgi:hypothetical protein